MLLCLRILTEKTHPQTKRRLMKSMNMDMWVVDTLIQVFIRSSNTKTFKRK